MKLIAVLALVALSGCSTVNKAICYGNGTCNATGDVPLNSAYSAPGASTLQIGSSSYLIVPSQSGRVTSVIRTSK
jgi:uncharacterized protein YceK